MLHFWHLLKKPSSGIHPLWERLKGKVMIFYFHCIFQWSDIPSCKDDVKGTSFILQVLYYRNLEERLHFIYLYIPSGQQDARHKIDLWGMFLQWMKWLYLFYKSSTFTLVNWRDIFYDLNKIWFPQNMHTK